MTFEKIQNDIKEAMKSQDNLKRDCLRSVISEVKNLTVNSGKPITDEACMFVLKKSVKTHNDSISQFKDAKRNDLLEKEQKELDILKSYLPEMLSNEAIQTIILNIINENKLEEIKKNIGKVMKLLSQHPQKSQIDMRVASQYLNCLMR